MNKKMMSAIQKLVLTDATFNGETVEPTFINFFYGKNGAGKSTIARTIRGNLPGSVEWQSDRPADSYDVLVMMRTSFETILKTTIISQVCLPLRRKTSPFRSK